MIVASAAVLVLSLFVGCGHKAAGSLDEALRLYYQNELDEALPILQNLAQARPDDATIHAWLAETYRRLGRKAEAVETAEKALSVDPCNAFALVVIAESVNPIVGTWEGSDSDRTWHQVVEAVRCDSTDGSAWLILWGEALHRGNVPMMRQAERKMIETGFLTEAVLSYSRWTLKALPKNAILITNGDMDTYPTYAVQRVEGFRPDVAVVNRGLLTEDWYARYLRDHEGVSMPFDDATLAQIVATRDEAGNLVTLSDRIFQRWIEQARTEEFRRPIAIAATVSESYYAPYRDHLTSAGAFLLWSAKPAGDRPDITAIQRGLKGVHPEDFAGPWASDQDRSPIRRMYTRNIVRNVTAAALTVGESMVESKDWGQARAMADWASELESTSEAAPAFAERIAALRKAAEQK